MNTPGSYKYNDHTYILIQDLNLVRMKKKKKERKDMKRVKSFSSKSASSDFFLWTFYFIFVQYFLQKYSF